MSLLDASLVAKGITGMKYIIDTGRNGVPSARTDCSNWCNINKAGLGVPPTINTASSGVNNIDAFFWVKPPGTLLHSFHYHNYIYNRIISNVREM